MHLLRYTLSTPKNKKIPKLTKSKLQELELDWRKHNKDMKKQGLHNLRYSTLNDYINYRFGFVKVNKDFKPYEAKTPYRRETKYYPSLSQQPVTKENPTARKEPKQYTGTLIKGISQTHKSNAVPVISQEHIIDIGKMRR